MHNFGYLWKKESDFYALGDKMGWFDEQIKNRIQKDQQEFEESVFRMVSSIVGKSAAKTIDDERVVAKEAVEEIIKYYGFKPDADRFNELDINTDLQSILSPYGIMYREVSLDEEWYKEAYGPMMGKLKEGELALALLPGKGGYTYYDYSIGKKIKINKSNAELISPDAICFYRPLPNKKLGLKDLLIYLNGCIDISDILVYFMLVLLTTLVEMILPSLVGVMSDFILKSGQILLLLATAIFVFVCIISKHLVELCSEVVIERIELKTGISVEAAVMNRVLNLPAGFFKKYTAGELSSRINSVSELCDLLLKNVFSLPVTSLFSLLLLTKISDFAPGLVKPAFGIMFVSMFFSIISIFIQANLNSKIREYSAKEDGIGYALINGIQKIRLAGAEKRAFAKWAVAYTESADLLYNPPLIIKLNTTINMTIGIVGNIILYLMAVSSGISGSEYLSFTVAYGLLESAFSSVSSVALTTANIRPILKMAEPILEAEPENTAGKVVLNKISGSIEVSNVHFRYSPDMPKVLDGISFKVKAGEYVAIVGKTGCGKSTLIRLLLGYEKPQKGAIYFDRKDIDRVDMTSLRRKVGVVTQNGSLFQGDIYSNIVITDPTLNLERAWEAAEIADIADDIRKMPMGMSTVISEGQGGISGGQKQRLMIARAVAPKPKVLIMDEATSALDNITQKKVSDALDKLKCTRIVIAHRLSTIKNCDRILVIDEGKIVEDGKYDDLIAAGGFFAKLVERQQV